jgi:hypothetical protein
MVVCISLMQRLGLPQLGKRRIRNIGIDSLSYIKYATFELTRSSFLSLDRTKHKYFMLHSEVMIERKNHGST